MNLNSVFKFGSKASVIISAFKPQTIGGKSLQEGEPFIKIDNVNINIGYGTSTSGAAKGVEQLLQTSKEIPTRLTISGVPINEKILSLLYSQKQQIEFKTFSEKVSCEQNTIILSHDNNKKIFIYNLNKELVLALEECGQVITNELLVDENYLVFYKHQIEKSQIYSTTSPHISYLTLEIEGVGNENEVTSNVYLSFKKCALITTAKNTIDFEDSINTIELNFAIIDGDKIENSTLVI